MKRLLTLLTVLAFLFGGCGGSDEPAETTSALETTSTSSVPETTSRSSVPETTEASPTAVQIADRMLGSFIDGDVDAWRDCYAVDAIVRFPAGDSYELYEPVEWVSDDFDGDGVATRADFFQFVAATGPAFGADGEWICEALPDSEARCSGTESDLFYELAGVGPSPWRQRFVVDAGRIIERHIEEVREATPEQPGGADRVREVQLAYERWVRDTHPERSSMMFHEPCCDFDLVRLPEAVPHHEELMPEYLATLGHPERAMGIGQATGTITVLAERLQDLEGYNVVALVFAQDPQIVLERIRSGSRGFPALSAAARGITMLGEVGADRCDPEEDPCSLEEIVHPSGPTRVPFLEERTAGVAEFEPGSYTIAMLAHPRQIVNWADGIPFAQRSCVAAVDVVAGEDARVVITDIPVGHYEAECPAA